MIAWPLLPIKRANGPASSSAASVSSSTSAQRAENHQRAPGPAVLRAQQYHQLILPRAHRHHREHRHIFDLGVAISFGALFAALVRLSNTMSIAMDNGGRRRRRRNCRDRCAGNRAAKARRTSQRRSDVLAISVARIAIDHTALVRRQVGVDVARRPG